MQDAFDDLMRGSDSVRTYTLRDGRTVLIRSGTRSERNRIEQKMGDKTVMDGIALFMFLRAANEDGTRRFAHLKFNEFAEQLDYDMATEIAMLSRRGDFSDDELSLDGKVAEQVKN